MWSFETNPTNLTPRNCDNSRQPAEAHECQAWATIITLASFIHLRLTMRNPQACRRSLRLGVAAGSPNKSRIFSRVFVCLVGWREMCLDKICWEDCLGGKTSARRGCVFAKGLRTCFILLDKGLRSQLIHATDYTRYMYKGTPIMHIRVGVFSHPPCCLVHTGGVLGSKESFPTTAPYQLVLSMLPSMIYRFQTV